MSLRTSLLYLVIACLLMILIGALIWPFLNVDAYLRDYILGQIDDLYVGNVDLKNVTPGFFALNLYGFEIEDSLSSYCLIVDKIHIGFSLLDLIASKFDFLNSISSLIVTKPELFVRLPDEKAEPVTQGLPKSSLWGIVELIPDFCWIDQARLENGIIHLLTPEADKLGTLQYLSGEIRSGYPGNLDGVFHLGGSNENASNLEVSLLLNSDDEIVESVLKGQFIDLQVGADYGLPDSLTVQVDNLDIDLKLWVEGSEDGFEGTIDLNRYGLYNAGEKLVWFDSTNLTIKDWELTIPPSKGQGLTARWTIRGGISDVRKPAWDLDIDCISEDCSHIPKMVGAKSGISTSGILNSKIQIGGHLFSPEIKILASLDSLITPLDSFYGLSVEGSWKGKNIYLQQLRAISSYDDLLARGEFTFLDSAAYRGNLVIDGAIPGISGTSRGTLDIQFAGSSSEHALSGRWYTAVTPGDTIQIITNYSGKKNIFTANLALHDRPASINLFISEVKTEPRYQFEFDQPIEIVKKFFYWSEWWRLENVYITGEMNGTLEAMRSRIEAYYSKGGSRFQFDGIINTITPGDLRYIGSLKFQQGTSPELSGQLDLNWKDMVLTLENLELDDAIYGKGSVDFESGYFGSTELRVSNWDAARGLQLIAPEWGARAGGVIDGRFELFGNVADPLASINLYVSRGYLDQRAGFWAVFSADFAGKTLVVNECNLGRSLSSLIDVSGSCQLDGSNLNFIISSENIDASEIVSIVGINPSLLGGNLNYYATLTGSLGQPALDFKSTINPGNIYKVPFDSLEAEIVINQRTGGIPEIKRLRVVQEDDLILTGIGGIPLKSNTSNLQLTLEGNILKLPHLIEPSIQESNGQGRVYLEIARGDEGLFLQDGELELHDGFMKFPDVVKEIKNLNADIYLDERHVVFKELSGEIDKHQFSITNRFDSTADSIKFESLYFGGVDLNLGVINLETTGRGIYAHIPTLMTPGSMGYFRFQGKGEGEKFTLAGPVDNITIRGGLRASRTIVTYPFPPAQKPPSPFTRGVLKVLSTAHWDLDIFPERDNRYERQIQSELWTPLLEGMSELFTTVDINLNVNPGQSHLTLLGNIDGGSFRTLGSLVATRGTIEYLDLNFNVDRFTADFDEHDPLPWVEGRGQTVFIDSLGQTRNVYLTLYVVDPTTGERTLRGRWGDFVFILEDDEGSSQEQILANMGYSPEQITEKVTSLSGQVISDVVLRRLIRPIERELEALLRVDYIHLKPTIAQNVLESQVLGLGPGPDSEVDWGAYFLNQSQLSVGKYITDDIFISYTGLWESAINAENERHFGFIHRWGLEYRITPVSNRLTMNFDYEYDSLEQLRDREVKLRYWILF